MDRDLTTASPGPSLPSRRFASTQFRTSTHAVGLNLFRTRRTLCAVLISLLGLGLSPMHAQTNANLSAPWKPLGPTSVVSATYNNLTGRVTAIATDPTGNTVYIGTTGGGVWKSVNAAGSLASATFVPLTDTLPVFAANAGSSIIPSLTIGAIALQSVLNPVLLAGTGDPNDATDSYYGEGILRSADNGLTWTLIQGSLDGANGNHSFTGLVTAGIAFSTATPMLAVAAFSTSPQSAIVNAAGVSSIPGLYYSSDATDSYYGEGILRSADNGLTWTLIQGSLDGANGNHSFTGLVTAGIAFSTATPMLAVAAFSTSPQSAIVNAAGVSSIPGLYYSSDAGVTWHMSTIMDGATVVQQPQPLGTSESGNAATSVVWDLVRGQFFAAVRSHGYYSSPDGITWTRLMVQPGTNLTTANCPANSNGTGSPNCPIFRGVLAVQPLTYDLYALTVDINDVDQGLWQDICNQASSACATPAPTFANRIDNGALDVGNGNNTIIQGSYNLALTAAPAAANATNLYVGTVDLYRCVLSAGSSPCMLRNTTNALNGCDAPAQVAPSQHAVAAVAQTNGIPILFLGNDSGLWRSLDGVAETGSACSSTDNTHFDNLNRAIGSGGSLAEVTGFAENPTATNILIAGLGANGSAATSTASALTPWPQLSTGEGGYPSIDANTPANWYVTIGAGVNLIACTLGGSCNATDFIPPATIGAAQVDLDASLLDAPTLLDPALTSSLLIGTCRVWRGPAASGSTWSNANALSPAMGGITVPCSGSSPLIRSIGAGGPSFTAAAVQNSGSEVIYAGIAGSFDGGNAEAGHLFVTAAANTATSSTAWTDAALAPVTNDLADTHLFNPGQYDISAIAVDPHDATGGTVYATVMGFNAPHLYRSTNFGASWINISANLPDAPANAVVVDPNDANTVYIAMDTGVYETQAVSTCYLANCWTTLGTLLPNSPVVALSAGAKLSTGDGRIGMLRAGTYGRGLWQTPLLAAGTLIQPAIKLAPTSFTFASQQVGTQSSPQTLTITSTGNGPVTFGTFVLTGDFAETDNCAGQTLAVNSTCTAQIVFAPTAIGARSGQLTIYADISGGQAIVPLNGTATAPAAIVLTPLSLTFAATIVNQTTAAQIITVANTGGNAATLQTPVIVGETSDFTINADTCTATLATQTACSVSIVFSPTVSGARSATLSVVDNLGTASAATQTAQLTGTGNAPATDTLSPLSLTFAQQQIGTTSASQQVTLSNTGGVALTLIAASVSPGDFSVVNSCGNSLSAHSSCVLNVTFAPTATGARSATLTVTDQFRFQTVLLNGSGIAGPGVSLSPFFLTFPATGVGLTAVAQSLVLTNNGGLPLTITNLAVSAGFNLAANTCGTTVAANAVCNLTVVFAPTAAGALSGALTFTDNAPAGVQSTNLSGTGIDFSLTAAGNTTLTLAGSGATGNYPMLLSSLAGLTGNVALTCAGAPTNSTCVVAPSVAPLGGTTTISVTVETAVTVADLMPPAKPFSTRSLIVLALLLPIGLALRRRRVVQLVLLACIFGFLGGCGTSRIIPGGGGGTGPTGIPTPAGTYTLVVGASSSGLTHSVNVALVVQ